MVDQATQFSGRIYPDPDPNVVATIRLPPSLVAALDGSLGMLNALYPDSYERASKRLDLIEAELNKTDEGKALKAALYAVQSGDVSRPNAILLRGARFENEASKIQFYMAIQQYVGVLPEQLDDGPETKITHHDTHTRDRMHHDTMGLNNMGNCAGGAVMLIGRSVRANPFPTLVIESGRFLDAAAEKIADFQSALQDMQTFKTQHYGDISSLQIDGLQCLQKHFPKETEEAFETIAEEIRRAPSPRAWLEQALQRIPKASIYEGGLAYSMHRPDALSSRPMLDWDMEMIPIDPQKPEAIQSEDVGGYVLEMFVHGLLEYTGCDQSIATPVWIPQDGALILNNRTMVHGRGDAEGRYADREHSPKDYRRTLERVITPPTAPARTFAQDELARADADLSAAYRG
jgi:hypothetical protein